MSMLKIISGGQTGVDRAALDAAIESGVEHGGWCPRGRRAEDGAIPDLYQLAETPSTDYRQRTEWNVRDADATLIIYRHSLSAGTALTCKHARAMRKPFMLVDTEKPFTTSAILDWLGQHRVQTLNVAGPRQSSAASIYPVAYALIIEIIEHFTTRSGT